MPSRKLNTSVTIARLNDVLLGSFGAAIPPSEGLHHSVRYFGTWSGSDKLMMTLQYAAKLLIPVAQRHAEQQYLAGKRLKPVSPTSEGLFKLAGSLSLARRVSALPGFLGVLHAMAAQERNPPASRTQLTLQRLQGISMLAFYPLEYLSFLSSPFAPVLPISPSLSGKAQLWSVRAWGVFVALQIMLLRNELVGLDRQVEGGEGKADVDKTRKRKELIKYQLAANISRLPFIIHWSIIGGIYKNEIWSSVFSFISAIAAFRGGWESSRIPSPTR